MKQQISGDDTDGVRMTGVRFVTYELLEKESVKSICLYHFLTCLQKISALTCEGQLSSFEKAKNVLSVFFS